MVETSIHRDSEADRYSSTFSGQAISFLTHTILALGIWLLVMLAGYLLNPPPVSQSVILVLSLVVPLAAGFLINRFRQDEMAGIIWLAGLILLLILSVWVLDMPTGPNACFQCSATEKLTRTFFSIPKPSGLIDDDGPFFGTWPAAALIGYSIGARLAMRHRAG